MTHLMKSLPIVAKMLGDKFGVKVEIGNHHPQTDGDTIYLPRLPVDDERSEILLRGFLDHEAAHVRFKSGLLSGSPMETALQNILEDIRIEMAMGKSFPGSKQNLSRMIKQLVAEQRFEYLDDGAHPGAVVQAFLLHRLRADVLEQESLLDLAADSERRFHETFSPGKAVRIEALARTAADCQSIEEIKSLVTRILASLAEDEDETPDNTPYDSPESNETDQAQADESQDTQDGDSSECDDNDNVEAQADSAGGESQDDSPSDTQAIQRAVEQALDADDDDLDADVGKMIADELSSAAESAPDQVLVAEDQAGHIDRCDYLSPDGAAIDAKRARRATNALRSRLHGLIQASRMRRQPPQRHGRQIDSSRLARIACRDTRVFRAQRETPSVNTAIHLLLDRSGSMNQSMQLACETLFASALALESISRVAVESCIFPVSGCHVATLTPFGQRVSETDYAVRASGGTPLAEAMWHVASALSVRSEPRKISVVVTDGEPNPGSDPRAIIDMMQNAGIEVIGIGIKTMSVMSLFPRSEVIDSIDTLPSAVFKLLERPLLAQSA